MQTIYILTRACDLITENHSTIEAANNSSDRWEADGHEVYKDRLSAFLEYDRERRRNATINV